MTSLQEVLVSAFRVVTRVQGSSKLAWLSLNVKSVSSRGISRLTEYAKVWRGMCKYGFRRSGVTFWRGKLRQVFVLVVGRRVKKVKDRNEMRLIGW